MYQHTNPTWCALVVTLAAAVVASESYKTPKNADCEDSDTSETTFMLVQVSMATIADHQPQVHGNTFTSHNDSHRGAAATNTKVHNEVVHLHKRPRTHAMISTIQKEGSLFSLGGRIRAQLDKAGGMGAISKFLIIMTAVGLVCAPFYIYFASPAVASSKGMVEKENPEMTRTVLGVLMSFTMLTIACTTSYVPNMPDMAVDLRTSDAMMGATLEVNWFIKAFMMLVAGPLSDRIGRRPIYLGCSLMTAVSTIACATAPDINWFLAARMIQGIAECGDVIPMAVVRDMVDDPEERQACMKYIMLVVPLAPLVAPAFGGFVGAALGWRVPFVVLACLGLMNFTLGSAFLPETHNPNEAEESLGIKHALARILSDQYIVTLMICIAATQSNIFTINTNVSFLLREIGLSTEAISGAMCSIPIIVVLGVILNSVYSKRLDALNQSRAGFTLLLIPIAYGVVLVITGCSTVFTILFGSYAFALCFMPVYLPSSVLVLEPIKDVSGLGSGLLGCLTYGAGSLLAAGSNQVVKHYRVQGLFGYISLVLLIVFSLFWGGFGMYPPVWAHHADEDEIEPHSPKIQRIVSTLSEICPVLDVDGTDSPSSMPMRRLTSQKLIRDSQWQTTEK